MAVFGPHPVRLHVKTNNIPKIRANMKANASRIVRKATLDIQAGAVELAPYLTGFLAGSIQSQLITPLHGRITVGADYGIYVHEGTRSMPARPFLKTSFERVVPSFLLAMRKVFG